MSNDYVVEVQVRFKAPEPPEEKKSWWQIAIDWLRRLASW